MDFLISSGDSEHAWMVILLTDGRGSYSSSYTQQAIANNITVYTVGLGSGVNSDLLTSIATATGGQYYPVSSAGYLPEVFRVISENIVDTDGDGLPDIVETSGFRDGANNWYYTDPYNNDTDGDMLTDGEEAGVLMDVDGKIYFNVISNATCVDTDGDHLSDYEEVRGSTIYVADTHDSAVDFLTAVNEGNDPMPYLTSLHVTSDPQKKHSDSDGLNDYYEISMGTNPSDIDTDSDHIYDNRESLYDEDPAIFDLTAPDISSEHIVRKESFSALVEYCFWYEAKDGAGVEELSLFKNGISEAEHHYSTGNYKVSENTNFTTEWETILDALRGAQVTIEAADQNGNSKEKLAYHRSSQYGMWAAQLGSENIFTAKIANDLGILAGASMVLSELPSTAIELCNDPVGYLTAITDLFSSILSDPTLIADIAANLPGTIIDLQEMENPYDVNDGLYDDFETGWYSGYVSMSLATMYMGAEVTKGITSSEQFIQATSGITSKLDDIGIVLKNSGSLAKTKIIYMLIDDTASLGGDGSRYAKAASKMDITEIKTKQLVDDLQDVQVSKLGAATDEDKLCTLLSRAGDDGVSFVNSIDENKLKKLFSISSDKLDSDLMSRMSANLAKLNKADTPVNEIESFIDNIDTLKNVDGVDKIVRRAATGREYGNFKGVAFEAEFAANSPDNVITLGKKTAVGKPGDIDVLMTEGDDLIGYECKNRNFGTSKKDLEELRAIRNGFDELKQNSVVDDYKIMFRERPRDDLISIMDSENIQWDYFVK